MEKNGMEGKIVGVDCYCSC